MAKQNSSIILSVIILSVAMLNVIMLSVMAPMGTLPQGSPSKPYLQKLSKGVYKLTILRHHIIK